MKLFGHGKMKNAELRPQHVKAQEHYGNGKKNFNSY